MAAQHRSVRLARVGQDLERAVGRGLRRAGIDPARITQGSGLDPHEPEVIRAVDRFTMTSPERIAAVCQATSHVASNEIQGAIGERSVWRGGSTMAAAYTLIAGGERDPDLSLYDTYAGMAPPTEADRYYGHRQGLGGRSTSIWRRRGC